MKMLRRLLTAGLLLGLTAAAGPASAQSLYGPGGLFLHPTANVPPKGKLTPATLVLPQHNPQADSTRTWITGVLDYGLTDDIEVGFTAIKVTGWDRDPSFGGFGKWRFLRETKDRPALAVGFTQLGFGDVNARKGFLAAGKGFKVGRHNLVTHLGVEYVDESDGISMHRFKPYGGLEFGITPRLTFIAEGAPGSRHDFGTPLALSLSYRAGRNYNVVVSWANNGLSNRPMFGIGVGISLGDRR